VNSGLILAADNEGGTGGSHGSRDGARRRLPCRQGDVPQQYSAAGDDPLIFVGGAVGYGAYEASGLAVPLAFIEVLA